MAPPRGFEPRTLWLRSDSDYSESRTIPLPWPIQALGSESLVSAPAFAKASAGKPSYPLNFSRGLAQD